MKTHTGYLTIYSADRSEIYGEFADADLTIEETRCGANHIFTGTAGEGALNTFRTINANGISHVEYMFESNGYKYLGRAQLLAPETNGMPGHALIRIETGDAPARG